MNIDKTDSNEVRARQLALADALTAKMVPAGSEAEAIQNLVDAYATYAQGAAALSPLLRRSPTK